MANELSVLVMAKAEHRFIYLFDDSSRADAIDAIRNHAADPTCVLSWLDASVLTERVRSAGSPERKAG